MDDYDDDDDEELVGTEEESKNWKGIVISLVVIAFILAMIVLAIALVTPGKVEIDPGDPFTLSHLTDPALQSTTPIFQFSSDGKSYVTVTGSGTEREIVLVDLKVATDELNSPTVLVPKQMFITELKQLEEVTLSPDGKYLLLKIQPENQNKPSYWIWNITFGFVQDSHFKEGVELDMATWLMNDNKLMYLKENSILYKPSLKENPITVSASSLDENTLIGLPDKLYTDILKRKHLTWLSPDGSKVVFTKVRSAVNSSSSSSGPTSMLRLCMAELKMDSPEAELSFLGLNINMSYLVGVSWFGTDQLMTVWLNYQQQRSTYMLCDAATLNCTENFIYYNDELKWVDFYETPVINQGQTKFYTILPDPANGDKFYRHLTAVKLDPALRTDPKISFLTDYQWSDHKLIDIVDDVIYYTSTSSNYTHRHLYSYRIQDSMISCLTCDIDLGTRCWFVDATLNSAGEWAMLSCLGPDVPSHYVVSTQGLANGTVSSQHQIGRSEQESISSALENVKVPIVEYLTIPLDSGYDASVKFFLPPELNRTKIYIYGLVIIIPDGFGNQQATQEYPDLLTTYLAKNQSYIVAHVDLRGSSNRGERIRQSVHMGLGLKESHDVQQIVKYLIDRAGFYRIDESMIAVIGYGYGGFIALHTTQKDAVPCAVAVSPVTDLSSLSEFDRNRYMGLEETDLSANELKYNCMKGEDCSVPLQQNILLIHGTIDEVVEYSNSLNLMRKLQLAGYEFKQQIYPDVGHDIASSSVQTHYYITITSYLSQCFNTTSVG